MKNLVLIFAALLIGTIAKAEVKPAGTVLPTLCSAVENNDQIKEICFSRVVGDEGRFVTVRNAGGMTAVRRIVQEDALPTYMHDQSVASVLTLRLETLRSADGYISIPYFPEVNTLNFVRDLGNNFESYRLEGEISGQAINASKFGIRFHTQRL